MKVTQKNIGLGDSANLKTIDTMKRLALRDASDPVVVNIANKIRKGCGGDDYCEAYSAWKYVFDNVEYIFDHKHVTDYVDSDEPENLEFVIAPKYLLSTILKGDCDCMATSIAAINTALGLKTNFKMVAIKSDTFSHIYAEVYIPSKNIWVPVDPVIKAFGKEKRPFRREKVVPANYDSNGLVMTSNLSGLGATDENSNFSEYEECIYETYKAVNYNAKAPDGTYPCRLNECYPVFMVENVIKTYHSLVLKNLIPTYSRSGNSQQYIANIEKAVSAATGQDQGKVAAVLFELFYGVQSGRITNTNCLNPKEAIQGSILKTAAIITVLGGGGWLLYSKWDEVKSWWDKLTGVAKKKK